MPTEAVVDKACMLMIAGGLDDLRVDTIVDATLELAHGGSLDAQVRQLP